MLLVQQTDCEPSLQACSPAVTCQQFSCTPGWTPHQPLCDVHLLWYGTSMYPASTRLRKLSRRTSSSCSSSIAPDTCTTMQACGGRVILMF